MSISEDGTLPGCQAPDPNTRTPKITVPAKACDCHAHVFGPTDRFPYDAGRTYEPPEAPYDKYRKMLDTIGVERACLVQSSIHGTDNSAMLDAIVQSDGRLRGIAALPDGYTDADLIRLHDAGVRGVHRVDQSARRVGALRVRQRKPHRGSVDPTPSMPTTLTQPHAHSWRGEHILDLRSREGVEERRRE